MPGLDMPLFNFEGPEDETALAQLGAATAVRWQKLPKELREDIMASLGLVAGLPRVPELTERVTRLIGRHERGPE